MIVTSVAGRLVATEPPSRNLLLSSPAPTLVAHGPEPDRERVEHAVADGGQHVVTFGGRRDGELAM